MEEDLKYIDFIDKYLSGSLRGSEAIAFQELLKNDADFKKEVEIYKRIYSKIEASGEANFKKRLDLYYKEYLEEKSTKPRGIYKKLIIISSIAAALIFGIFIVNNNVADQQPIFNQQDPVIVDSEKDSVEVDKTIEDGYIKQEEVIVQDDNTEGDSTFIPGKTEYNTQLSIGGLQKLPAIAIRNVNYPVSLQYTFDGREIILFGNPSISGLQLQILKETSNNYFLMYQASYYAIAKSASKKELKTVSDIETKTTASQEEIIIKLKGIDAVSSVLKNIEVSFTGNKTANPTYIFEKKENRMHLVIDGNLPVAKTNFYKIEQYNESDYFLKIEEKLYQLNLKATEPTPLIEINILTNKLTRLFREDRELSPKAVYLID